MIVRSSLITTAMRCPTEAYFRYHLGLVPKGRKESPDLFFGTAVHRAVEIGLAEGKTSALRYLEGLLWPPSRIKNKKAAIILVTNLLKKDLPFKPKVTEQLFEVVMGEHVLIGRFDVVGESNDGICIADYKTTAPAYLINKPNTQFILYTYAAKQLYEKFDRLWVINLDPSLCEIKLYPVYFSIDELSTWEASITRFINFIDTEFNNDYPIMYDSCVRYFKHFCGYHDICTSNASIRQRVIDSCYNVRNDLKELSY